MFREGDNVLFKGKYEGVVQWFSLTRKEYAVYFPKYRGRLDLYKNCSVLDLEYCYQQRQLPF